jgi:hypothetical protein
VFFWDWPNFMVTRDGQDLMIARQSIFMAEFDYMMTQYFARVPDGRFKFNLGGMDNNHPDTLTTWELRTISTSGVYAPKTDYYLFEGLGRTALTPVEAAPRITAILSNP